MKRVTLLLPDNMIMQQGDKRGVTTRQIVVDKDSITDALSYKWEYHLDFYFEQEQIKVLSIEDVRD